MTVHPNPSCLNLREGLGRALYAQNRNAIRNIQRMKMPINRKSLEPIPYVFPAVLFLLSIMIYPMIYLLNLSVRKASFLRPPMPFNGLDNFLAVISSHQFLNSVYNTLTWTAGSLVLTGILGLVTALVFNEEFKGRNFFRVIVLLPWIFPYVAAAIMWRFLLTHPFGHFNAWLSNLGLISGDAGVLGSSDSAMANATRRISPGLNVSGALSR